MGIKEDLDFVLGIIKRLSKTGPVTIDELFCDKKLPYVMYSVDYRHNSAGIRACHRLVHELNEMGYTAYSVHETNPDWNELHWNNQTSEFIAIYPEIIYGNPLSSKKVVRWVLNIPGKVYGPTTFNSKDMIFTWDSSFLSNVPILTVDIMEHDLFFYTDKQENNDVCFFGKGYFRVNEQSYITKNMRQITDDWPPTRNELAELLRNTKTLYTYDNCTSIINEAFACGCKVILMPENTEVNQSQKISKERYLDMLNQFIKITQQDNIFNG
jgi:hypothetical protein